MPGTPLLPALPASNWLPRRFKRLLDLSQTLKKGPMGERLIDLIWLRVSQLNGCAFCIDMHGQDLLRQGLSPRGLKAVAGWLAGQRRRFSASANARPCAGPNSSTPPRTATPAMKKLPA